jgi:hypothetical protein
MSDDSKGRSGVDGGWSVNGMAGTAARQGGGRDRLGKGSDGGGGGSGVGMLGAKEPAAGSSWAVDLTMDDVIGVISCFSVRFSVRLKPTPRRHFHTSI